MSAAPSPAAGTFDVGATPQDQARAILNILEDFAEDKGRLEKVQHAIFNILEDFSQERSRLQETQSAMLNLLDDFGAERAKAEAASLDLQESVKRLRAANDAAAASNRELEAFSYSVSHDLRAPLRHISGFSKMLMDEFGTTLPKNAQHYVERIDEGTRRMGQLVDDLLNLARVGRRDLSLQVTGLRTLVDEVIADLEPDIGDRKVEWKVADLPYADCDAALIKQVFQNLLANAVKFTRPRERAMIEIGQEQHEGSSAVYIRDNGVGFSMKYADKLFGVFQRLHRAEDFEGTGIGLASVQRIIQKHGGRIWAEAELDKGATFYFTIGTVELNALKAKSAIAGDKA